ncbi:MAG TPA: response regulator [Polyangiaceae bacterium]|jgi:DNA-binding response OmpR family regulator|nr:response regulator [Polyangiaceae bacterium]
MTELEEKVVILVADDEPSTLALVSSHVRSLGYKVLEASDGDQAWQLAHENLPDLVVLDVMMPGMSGWEVCRKIREAVSLAHTGVIMLTGIGENLNEMTSPLYGADQYIDKPFEFADLDEKIRSTLEERRNGAMGRPHPESDVPSSELESTAHVSTGNGIVKVPRTRAPAKKKAPASDVAFEVEAASTKPRTPRAKAKAVKGARAPEAKAARTPAKAVVKKASKAKAAPVARAKASKKVAAKAAPVAQAKATKKAAPAKATKKAPTAKAASKKAPKKAAAKKAVAAKAAPAKAASKKAVPVKVASKKAPKKAAAKAVAAKAAPVKAAPKKAPAKKAAPPAPKAAKAKAKPGAKETPPTAKSKAPLRARRGAAPATLN